MRAVLVFAWLMPLNGCFKRLCHRQAEACVCLYLREALATTPSKYPIRVVPQFLEGRGHHFLQ